MDASRKHTIRQAAQDLLRKFWLVCQIADNSLNGCDEFLCNVHERLITEHFGFSFSSPREIPSDPLSNQTFETAGTLDLVAKAVSVASKHPLAWRRFTAAHEIGHIVLHQAVPSLKFHRDRPLTGGELFNSQRPPIEREADYFAAHLLMPAKHIQRVFKSYFREPIDTNSDLNALASLLSSGAGRVVSAGSIASRGPDYVAFLVAETQSFGPSVFTPLAPRFRVSPTAMGYQLRELGLVR